MHFCQCLCPSVMKKLVCYFYTTHFTSMIWVGFYSIYFVCLHLSYCLSSSWPSPLTGGMMMRVTDMRVGWMQKLWFKSWCCDRTFLYKTQLVTVYWLSLKSVGENVPIFLRQTVVSWGHFPHGFTQCSVDW